MKKTFIIITAICISIGSSCFAQEKDKPSDDREKFQVGIKAGANYCGLFDEHAYDFSYDTKFAVMGGAYFTSSISKYLGLQTEVLYSRRQVEFEGRLPLDVSGATLDTRYKNLRQTSHIDIPFYLQLKQGENLVFVLGPYITFLLSKQDKYSYSDQAGAGIDADKTNRSQAVFDSQTYPTSTFGFGGGVDYRISRFVIGIRGYRDLSDTNKDSSIRAPYYKNKMFVLSLGFKLI